MSLYACIERRDDDGIPVPEPYIGVDHILRGYNLLTLSSFLRDCLSKSYLSDMMRECYPLSIIMMIAAGGHPWWIVGSKSRKAPCPPFLREVLGRGTIHRLGFS